MAHLRFKANTLLLNLSKGPSLDTLLFLLHHSLTNRQSIGYPSHRLPPLEVDDHPNLGFQYLRLHYFEQRVQFLLSSQHSEVMPWVADGRIEGRVRV